MREIAGATGILKNENRGALHGVGDHGALHAPTTVQQSDAPIIGGDQRSLGGRQRNQEFALGMFAIYQERSRKAQWNLGHAGKMLNVSPQNMGIERIFWNMLQLDSRELFDKFLPCANCRLGKIILTVPGNSGQLGFGLGDSVFHFYVQIAERFGLEANRDFMFACRKRAGFSQNIDFFPQRKINWVSG